jgi:hypothetical protein
MIPEDPLAFIRRCVMERHILWTHHVTMRMQMRCVEREAILSSVPSFEIIESYPHDKYLPSYLVYLHAHGSVYHALFAVDIRADNVRVVTAYRPSPEEWDISLKRRAHQ